MPPIDHAPESVEAARARYPESIRRLFTTEEAVSFRPGQHRQHVFDFEDGLRIIVSREFDPSWRDPEIHFSASAAEDSQIFHDVRVMGTLLIESFKTFTERRFRVISGYQGRIRFLGLSDRGVPHWVIPLDWYEAKVTA